MIFGNRENLCTKQHYHSNIRGDFMRAQNNEKDKKLTKFIGKASETGKKVVETIQKGVKNFSE